MKKAMVKHIVFWNLKEETENGLKAENALKIKEGLEALIGIVPGLLKAEVGIGIPENGWDLCLYTEFDNKEHLTAYRDHPAHKKVQEFVHQVITERVACDYVI